MSVLRTMWGWLLLGLLLAGLLVTLVFGLSVRDAEQRQRRARRATERAVSRYLRWTPLYDIEVYGIERLPQGQAYVLVANHESGLDGALLLMLATGARFVMASWLLRAPLLGWMLRQCQHIPVRRQSDAGLVSTVDAMRGALASGVPLALFPEGVYSAGVLETLRSGAFVAAHEARVPIVPVRLGGTGTAWRPGSWIVRGRHTLTVHVLAPLGAEMVGDTSVDALRQHVAAVLAVSVLQL